MAHVATITIDHTKVPGDLTDYVGLIVPDGSAGYSALYALCLEGGGDIRLFKSDDTTELAREIVSFSVSAETGEIHYKYSGTLSSSVDTDIHVYADGSSSEPAAGSTYGSEAVWSDYDYVSHNGGGGTDSTGGGLTGTANGGVTSGGTSGKLGDATLYDGTGDYFSYGDVLDYVGNVNVSLSAWAKRNGVQPDFWSFISKQNGSSDADQYEIRGANAGIKHNPVMQVVTNGAVYRSSSPTLGGSITMADDTWYLFHGQIVASTGVISLSMNASSAGSRTFSGYSIQNTTSPFKVGVQTVSSSRFFKGDIDEVRVGQTIRTTNWITTEYNNQNSPSTFYSVAAVAGGSTSAQAARRGVVMMM